ncbi:MAG: integrase family protein [Candidatus Thiodiazotropha sp. (ex Myrtea sp. 'scaly one' KF741663)]|nr:integrase family protein [Candidatus Thiodiazotropha sp. (ex Myrtea sp. 'scaly one' KF741663)]
MASKKLDTSITDTQAGRFLNTANERDTLWCERITGFHLIKLKKGGSWRYRYQDDTGRRRVATVGKYPAMKPQEAASDALEWRTKKVDVLATKAQKRREALQAAALEKHRTVAAYLDGPYSDKQKRKASGKETLSMIRFNFSAYLDRDMASLTKTDIREWQRAREAEGRANVTLKRAFGALKTMLKHAATDGDPPLLDQNPLATVTLDPPTNEERTEQLSANRAESRRLLTADEIEELHKGLDAFAEEVRAGRRNSRAHGKPHLPDLDGVAFPHWFIPFTYCALHTGLRPGDLYSLTWQELNMNFKRLTKIPQKTRHHPDPAQININPLPSELYRIMKAWWEQQGKPDTGLVFPSPVNGKPMDKQAHGRHWPTIRQLGGLDENLHFYALRHHFISTLVAAGVPMLTVARLVGHKSMKMIEQHYGHLCPSAAAEAMNSFSQSVARKAADSEKEEQA